MLAGPDDGVQAAIEAQIEDLGIRESVRFTGFIGDDEAKAAAYRASDVYVLPSRYEIQGITVMESLLNAVPTITTDRCGLAPTLVETGIGQVVIFGDVEALVGEIIAMLDQPDRARAQAAYGQQYIRENYNWDTLTDQWIEVYRACIAEARAGRPNGNRGR